MLNILNIFHKTPTVEAILGLIRDADERPSTERLEILKADLLKLARQAKEKVESQDPEHKKVLIVDPLTINKTDRNIYDWFVIGDIHGDFQSLSRILLKIYLRSNIDLGKIKIIFLGDYIDRGARPMEVLKLLFSLKTKWPEHFWLLRGNHEFLEIGDDGIVRSTVQPSDTIDFWKQYFGEEVFKALTQLFDVLPVALLQPLEKNSKQSFEETEKIMYVHGGIPRTEHLHLPLEVPQCWDGFCWSDPELDKVDVLNGPGRRFSFAKKDFFDFTMHHNISLIVRGHQVRKDGFDLHKEVADTGHRIITIHSCGGSDNPDSYYGPDIIVPRFLNMRPSERLPLPISVEEAYRDDFFVYGDFIKQNTDLFNQIISGLESKLKESSLINFNLSIHKSEVTEKTKLEDPSDDYDSGKFGIFLELNINEEHKLLNYEIHIPNYKQQYSIAMGNKWNLNEAINTISENITKAYPIFGKLPQKLLKNERSTSCQKSDPSLQ
jgi:serine/threonine-protein phosphatase PP1 catalytic subunit